MVRFANPRSALDITGPFFNDNQPFFEAFAVAWEKATTNGWTNLSTLSEACVTDASPSQSPTANPTNEPSEKPSSPPTNEPSLERTSSPTNPPSASPSAKPVSASPSQNVSIASLFHRLDVMTQPAAISTPTAHGQPNKRAKRKAQLSSDERTQLGAHLVPDQSPKRIAVGQDCQRLAFAECEYCFAVSSS